MENLKLKKYSLPMRIAHNFSAILFIITLVMGIMLEKNLISKEYFFVHKSFGISVFFLVLIRIFIKFNTENKPQIYSTKKIEEIAARITHFGLYFCLVSMPLSGFLMSSFFAGKDGSVNFFNLFKIPFFLEKNKELASFFNSSHEIITYISLFFIFLHLAGSFKHLIFEKVNIFKKMI
jgi:cytochrome b561